MGGIERREHMKAATAGGIALSVGGAQNLLISNETRAQGGPLQFGMLSWTPLG
jgi:hypothetical protein